MRQPSTNTHDTKTTITKTVIDNVLRRVPDLVSDAEPSLLAPSSRANVNSKSELSDGRSMLRMKCVMLARWNRNKSTHSNQLRRITHPPENNRSSRSSRVTTHGSTPAQRSPPPLHSTTTASVCDLTRHDTAHHVSTYVLGLQAVLGVLHPLPRAIEVLQRHDFARHLACGRPPEHRASCKSGI